MTWIQTWALYYIMLSASVWACWKSSGSVVVHINGLPEAEWLYEEKNFFQLRVLEAQESVADDDLLTGRIPKSYRAPHGKKGRVHTRMCLPSVLSLSYKAYSIQCWVFPPNDLNLTQWYLKGPISKHHSLIVSSFLILHNGN